MQGGDNWRHSKDQGGGQGGQGGQAIPVVVPIAVPVASAVPIAPSVALRQAQRVCGVALTTSMRRLFEESKAQFARRWILVDNSGSMAMHDGNRINPTTGRSVACTRWEELTASLAFHGEMAELLQAETVFQLLNRPGGSAAQRVALGRNNPRGIAELTRARATSPTGGTPLCSHLRTIAAELKALAPEFNRCHQRAVLIIATDGESSDGDIASALKPFARLPCTVVIRLCTDSPRIVKYWNEIDDDLELELDVLDDHEAEAAECAAKNPWLTYSLPIHRLREWGAPSKLFDLIDERAFHPRELARFADVLLASGGGGSGSLRQTLDDAGPIAFGDALVQCLLDEPSVADPLRKSAMRPLIDAAMATSVAKGERVTSTHLLSLDALKSASAAKPLLALAVLIALAVIFFL